MRKLKLLVFCVMTSSFVFEAYADECSYIINPSSTIKRYPNSKGAGPLSLEQEDKKFLKKYDLDVDNIAGSQSKLIVGNCDPTSDINGYMLIDDQFSEFTNYCGKTSKKYSCYIKRSSVTPKDSLESITTALNGLNPVPADCNPSDKSTFAKGLNDFTDDRYKKYKFALDNLTQVLNRKPGQLECLFAVESGFKSNPSSYTAVRGFAQMTEKAMKGVNEFLVPNINISEELDQAKRARNIKTKARLECRSGAYNRAFKKHVTHLKNALFSEELEKKLNEDVKLELKEFLDCHIKGGYTNNRIYKNIEEKISIEAQDTCEDKTKHMANPFYNMFVGSVHDMRKLEESSEVNFSFSQLKYDSAKNMCVENKGSVPFPPDDRLNLLSNVIYNAGYAGKSGLSAKFQNIFLQVIDSEDSKMSESNINYFISNYDKKNNKITDEMRRKKVGEIEKHVKRLKACHRAISDTAT